MPERTSYAHGVPSWVDVASPDVDGAAAFYGGLFGWEYQPGSEETRGYGMFALDGKLVAGVGPLQNREQPPAWSTYIGVDDADEILVKVKEAGGQVALAPMDVMDAGRMAFFIDTVGAFFGVWQPDQHHGAQLVGEPGTMGWHELSTRDPATAKAFYPAVFGWEETPWPGESTVDYTLWAVGDSPIAGLLAMDDSWPPEIPSYWGVYFIVDDADATAAKATELGGTVHVAPFDTPEVGRITMLADPSGAAFAVMAPAEMPAT